MLRTELDMPTGMREKETVLNQMLKEIFKSQGRYVHQVFKETYTQLKKIDNDLAKKGYTEVHPSRYMIVKLLEHAEGLL